MYGNVRSWCIAEEIDANPTSKSANIRTLSLAIVPGDQICTVAVDKEFLSQTLPERTTSTDAGPAASNSSRDGSSATKDEQHADNEKFL